MARLLLVNVQDVKILWPQTGPKDDFDRVPKNDTVNMRTETSPPPPGGEAFELSWGSAAQATNHKGNQY